jgi:hypothetical protein
MTKRVCILIFSLAFHLTGFAQNENDLFRYSKNYLNGSARYEGMAGSFGALGADVSAYQNNPAGYGRFSHSTLGIGVYGGSQITQSTFNNQRESTSKGQIAPGTIGVLFCKDVSRKGNGFLFHQIGFGYQQIDQFARKMNYGGQQFSSIIDGFVDAAQGLMPDELNTYLPFSSNLAYQTGVLYTTVPGTYLSRLNSSDVLHNRTVNYSGGTGEVFASFSANYVNKLYIGMNVGLRITKYKEEYVHSEELVDTSLTSLRSFDYSYQLQTKGNGLNLSVGAIYLISEQFRTGIAVHSPTFYEMTDDWSASMSAQFTDSSSTIDESKKPIGNYKYRLRTPTKITASLAYVFGTRGCLNIDVDYLDYRNAHFRSTKDINYTAYSYENENSYAKEVFNSALNFRIGGELVLNRLFLVRAGVATYGMAFKKNQEAERGTDWIASCGIGVRVRNMSIDMSYRRLFQARNYYAFETSQTVLADQNHRVTISLNVLF